MPLPPASKLHHWLCVCLMGGLALVPIACKTTPAEPGPAGAPGEANVEDKADVSFLLSMTYEEAKKLSPQNLVVPPFYKIAADEIIILKRDAAGQPLRARAKGHVFLQIDFREQLQALGQEAYIESGGEIILRGKPLLKRGRSVVEGLSDYTVYYIKGTRLQVIGSHRLAKQEGVSIEPGDGGGGQPESRLPSWNVTPSWQRSWKDGPNPILPALSPEDVPLNMRASPLLPLPEGADVPRQLPSGEPLPLPSPETPAPEGPAMKVPDPEPAPAGESPPKSEPPKEAPPVSDTPKPS